GGKEGARGGGAGGATPEEAWQGRQPAGAEERATFAEGVRRLEREARQEQGYPPEGPLGRLEQAAVTRAALRRALVAHGLLRFTSARHPTPHGRTGGET